MDERQHDGTLPAEGATAGDALGQGSAHTHPVSAPHEYTDESGTPRFSKGPHPPEQRADGGDVPEHQQEQRSSAQPNRR